MYRELPGRLIAVGALQLVLLAWIFVGNVYPMWLGEDVLLEMRAYDPRSLFRGQYVRLNFSVNQPASANELASYPSGATVYVPLEKSGEIYRATTILDRRPEEGLFLQGTVEKHGSRSWSRYRIRYGFESYFASPKRAKEIESRLMGRKLGKAKVRVAPDGKALLLELLP